MEDNLESQDHTHSRLTHSSAVSTNSLFLFHFSYLSFVCVLCIFYLCVLFFLVLCVVILRSDVFFNVYLSYEVLTTYSPSAAISFLSFFLWV